MSWKASGEAKKISQGVHGEKLRHADKLALLVIADGYNDHFGYAWASRQTLAEECLCSERTIVRLTDRLERFGLLSVEHRSGDTNRYRFPFITTPVNLTALPLPNESTRSATHLTPTPATHLTPKLDLTIKAEQEEAAQSAAPLTELKFPKPKSEKKTKSRWTTRQDRRDNSSPREFIDFAAKRREAEAQAERDDSERIRRIVERVAAKVGRTPRQKINGQGD